ncbi:MULTISPECIES: LysR substrate-binding domain-containing protein [unclassified Mesorhizobium]|uniref:LysR family transcriptional regulator n=1 Tax=unclassified Mesorhizobium TaxID=325217 RepID=UPI0015E36209|nr:MULTISPECIES: LysR substrate-binding domain-containing protein [unclassified Mesorhizobium]MBZ9974179.1 LysR family transcriptional regulator [Mesorhizobium sp. BR-1-1-10]
MRLRHIEVFHAIKQTGSISKAAALLGVSQPAASKVLQHAESSLGFRLFERVKGRLLPTIEAEALHVEVAKLHTGIEQLKMLAANLRRFPEGRLHIGCLPSLGLSIMPQAVSGFRRSYPAVTCEVETDHIEALVTALRARRLDFAVTLCPGEHPGLRTEVLGEVELVYFGSKPGPDITLAEIDGLDLVGVSSRDKIGALIAMHLEAAGRHFSPSIEVQTYFLACAIATAGNGATIVDELTARSMLREGFHIRRTVPRLSVEVGFLTHEAHVSRGFYADFIRALKTALNSYRRNETL